MRSFPLEVVWSTLLLGLAAASGDEPYEWAGIFAVPDARYMWTAQKVEGKYADATMKLAVLPSSEATTATLSALEGEGESSLKKACTPIQAGGVLIPKANSCYQLVFDARVWQSLFPIDTSNTAAVAFFAEHVPTEFENTAHYLKDKTGEDIEPVAELPEPKEPEPKQADWGGSIGASILVNLVTLVGLALAVPVFARLAKDHAAVFEGVLSAFAAGALLACAFFLLLFEATHLVGEGWETEVDILWRWGTMVITGFVLPAMMETAFRMATSKAVAAKESENGEGAGWARVVGAVTIGDFLHNLCDGFFIGAAFKGCGSGFGWGVALATILHEIPQELADYAILTGKQCGMAVPKVLLLNFLTGTSVLLGTIIINASDVANSDVGLLLAFGGGVYVYLAATECMPRMHHLQLSAMTHLACLVAFIVGAILIGLILLDHEHCVPDDGSGGHAHGHGH